MCNTKAYNINTGKTLNPGTNKSYMSNKEKAHEYDMASTEGVGCWYYECKNVDGQVIFLSNNQNGIKE